MIDMSHSAASLVQGWFSSTLCGMLYTYSDEEDGIEDDEDAYSESYNIGIYLKVEFAYH